MDRNVENYVRIFPKIIPEDISKLCMDEIRQERFRKHTWSDTNTGEESSYDEDPWVVDGYDNEKLNSIIWYCTYEYVSKLEFDWFTELAGFSFPRVNRYQNNQMMAPHCDRIKTLFEGDAKGDPTLTILGLFDSEFEGGDLVMFDETKVDFTPRDIVIFPSNFLFPHAITPVTSGERISFVSWTW